MKSLKKNFLSYWVSLFGGWNPTENLHQNSYLVRRIGILKKCPFERHRNFFFHTGDEYDSRNGIQIKSTDCERLTLQKAKSAFIKFADVHPTPPTPTDPPAYWMGWSHPFLIIQAAHLWAVAGDITSLCRRREMWSR